MKTKTCRAFYPISGTRQAWIPCVRPAEANSNFCVRHNDAVAGAMFGAIIHQEGEAAKRNLGGKSLGLRAPSRKMPRRKLFP
jgi:hypothetical protein